MTRRAPSAVTLTAALLGLLVSSFGELAAQGAPPDQPSRSEGAEASGQGAPEAEPARAPASDRSADSAVALAIARPDDADAALNAGVVLAHEGRLGEAVLYLERALILAPLDRGIQDARAVVQREARSRRIESSGSRTLTEGEPVSVTRWRFFALLPERSYAVVVLTCSWLSFGILLVRRRLRSAGWRDGTAAAAGLALLVLLSAAALWIGRAVSNRSVEPAVVVAAEPRYRDAPDELSRERPHADLYEGGVVRIVARRGQWTLVELVGGEEVWVAAPVAVPLEP